MLMNRLCLLCNFIFVTADNKYLFIKIMLDPSILEPIITYGTISVVTLICICIVWCFFKSGTSKSKIEVVIQDQTSIPVEIEQSVSTDILISQSLQCQQFIGPHKQNSIPSSNAYKLFSLLQEIVVDCINAFNDSESNVYPTFVLFAFTWGGALFIFLTVLGPLCTFVFCPNSFYSIQFWSKVFYNNAFHLPPGLFHECFGWDITFNELKELKRKVLSENLELLNDIDRELLKQAHPDRVADYFDKTLPDDMLKIRHQQAISDAQKVIVSSALIYVTRRGAYYSTLIWLFFYRSLFILLIIFIQIPSLF